METHLNLDIKGLSDFCLTHSPVLDWVMSPAGTTEQSLTCENLQQVMVRSSHSRQWPMSGVHLLRVQPCV